ncbi:glycosyltransferase family 4 protein [Demequina sp. SO4-18]|uniref:glycosyltransferase family 4 protein n=1 Tax=Demequina sp. SO4-18 TaxID=3401026 RepID=UPI003B5A2F91
MMREESASGGAEITAVQPGEPGAAQARAGRPLRVVHALKHGKRGNGSVHVAVDLACSQSDAGHQVWFAAAPGSYDDLMREHGVHVVVQPELTSARSFARGASGLLALVRSIDADVIHAHMMSSAATAWAVSRVTGATTVTTLHNSFDRHWWLMRAGKVMVAVSEAERALLRDRGVPPRKVRVVLNGAIGSAREELPPDDVGPLQRPGIIAVSGLHGRKGVDDLIRAFALVSDDFPQWHLNVVGWGPDREALEAQVADAGLAGSVHFLGPSLTPWVQLEQSEIFASAALDEPFGLNVAEARAAGCAIVATSVGGVPEILEHGRAGQLVPPHDAAAMAAALRNLMSDPAELARARHRSASGTEWLAASRMAADYEAVYREVIPSRRARSLAAPPRTVHRGAARRTRRAAQRVKEADSTL